MQPAGRVKRVEGRKIIAKVETNIVGRSLKANLVSFIQVHVAPCLGEAPTLRGGGTGHGDSRFTPPFPPRDRYQLSTAGFHIFLLWLSSHVYLWTRAYGYMDVS